MANFRNIRSDYADALVKSFQANDPTLAVDGIIGPKTRAAIEDYIRDNDRPLLLQRAWELALADVGQGGDPGTNNDSAYIRGLRRYCGFPVSRTGSWCAIFASAKGNAAGIPIKSRGAYRYCEKMANHPDGYEIEIDQMEAGQVYLMCWKRRRFETHREAHVAFVKYLGAGICEKIGGNERGDKVRHSPGLGVGELEKGLIMVVGWKL